MLAAQVEELSALQRMHYASNRYAVLLIFQGMDSAGKDGAIHHVLSGVTPEGCQVFSFKSPSARELDHDFLWRTTRALPDGGRIGIFAEVAFHPRDAFLVSAERGSDDGAHMIGERLAPSML